MIIGTAGHIDHGKTTLVRALTGVDTDRLKEEKERGISIELGYAYTPLADGEVLGFIDVPGHERLVHTMVAGACGIDFALLVIAADDGVMAQTREHIAIVELLGVSRGAVALTKVDRVDHDRLDQVQTEIAAALASTTLSGARVFPLNATLPGDLGVASLRRYLHDAAVSLPARQDQRLFRLAVDRVFTLTGHGTVVTGTVFSGEVRTGETVAVMPSGRSVRVRSIHAQNRPAERGRVGQRCALNLVGVETSDVSRGDWLATPGLFEPTSRVDVRLDVLSPRSGAGSTIPIAAVGKLDAGPSAPASRGTKGPPSGLGPWSTLHVHIGTARRVAHLVPLESTQPSVGAGGSVRAQLVFDSPVCTMPGDRFIVRDAQAIHTIGGGVVLDPFAPARRRRSAVRSGRLDALEQLVRGAHLAALLQQAPHGLPVSELVQLTALPAERITLPPDAITIDSGHEHFVIHAAHWTALRDRTLGALRAFHAQVPDDPGPDVGRLRRIAVPELAEPLWRALSGELVSAGLIVRNGPWLRLPEHTASLSDSDQELVHKLQPAIAAGRFDPPWVRDLAVFFREPEDRVRSVLRKSVTLGIVCQVVRDLFYDRECIGELATIATRLAQEHGTVEAARYRDVLGLGRKRTIQILEFFDRVGYTRRVKDSHVLRQDSGWRHDNRKVHAPGGAAGLQTQKGASNASW